MVVQWEYKDEPLVRESISKDASLTLKHDNFGRGEWYRSCSPSNHIHKLKKEIMYTLISIFLHDEFLQAIRSVESAPGVVHIYRLNKS